MTRRTKIVATIGPASDDTATLERLIEAGLDVVRLNLSHGPIDDHLERLRRVRTASANVGRPVGVLADLPGPKIRTGPFPDEGIHLDAGQEVRLRIGNEPSSAELVHIDFPTLLDDLEPGDFVVIGDGAISILVTEIGEHEAVGTIHTGARTQARPGVHLPSDRTHLASPTAADLEMARTMSEAGVDFLAVSFVRTGSDMEQVRAVVDEGVDLVAKIETSKAVEHLDEFLETSDAIMVARGDLGIDCPLEDLPHLQKSIVRRCVEYGTPVITATQMLESMITAPSPTRAEVTDVANAVFDGTDAVMLSGETAIGHDPVAVIETMSAIARRAEAEASYRHWAARLGRIQRERWDSAADRITAALTHAASEAAGDVGATAILCCTTSGRTAKAMARFRPSCALLALSPSPLTVNQLTMSWGVDPLSVDTYGSTDEMVWFAVERALAEGRIDHGDTVVVMAGSPSRSATTAADVLRIVQVE